jgi:hypothetical protein
MECGKPHAYRKLVCPEENCQQYGEFYFIVAVISVDGFLLQNPRPDRQNVIADLMRALWRVNLMLVLNHSLLNRGYILMKVLKANLSFPFKSHTT